MEFKLNPGHLSYADLSLLLDESTTLKLGDDSHIAIFAAEKTVSNILSHQKPVYGINTGFGALAHTQVDTASLSHLQHSLVLSHATGTGKLLPDAVVRLILALKINSLARGFSGIRLKTIAALQSLLNANVYPCIPSQGSVGASGDLAPLAHMSAVLLGIGNVRYAGNILTAEEGLEIANLEPLTLTPKEGLALVNGTQVSTALALHGLLKLETIFTTALIAGALSTDAALGSDQPFDARIQAVRGHTAQMTVATLLRGLLRGSAIRQSHLHCKKVQDPYSLRCQPQVMGACLAHLLFAKDTLLTEANAVTDNPLVFSADHEILSGGNFHAQPIAMIADMLAICIAEIGSFAERRIALLIDKNFSDLPPFLVKNAGLNSGFMSAQVTAAALASENKSLAHPASIDSIPTSANQEDHVSMATYAARRLLPMTENALSILAIELLAACQGIDFRRPLTTSPLLEKAHHLIREQVPFYEQDRYFAPDISAVRNIIQTRALQEVTQLPFSL